MDKDQLQIFLQQQEEFSSVLISYSEDTGATSDDVEHAHEIFDVQRDDFIIWAIDQLTKQKE